MSALEDAFVSCVGEIIYGSSCAFDFQDAIIRLRGRIALSDEERSELRALRDFRRRIRLALEGGGE